MRLLPVLSVLVAAVASASAYEVDNRVLVAEASTTAPPAASNATAAADPADIAKLREYYGDEVDKLTDKQLQQLIEKLHAETKDDPKGFEALLEDSKNWLAKVGNTIKAVFVGKDDNDENNDGGVFGRIWTSLFGKDSKPPSTDESTNADGSGSGAVDHDVGHSGSMDTTIEESTTASSAQEDTSIDTVAPTPTPAKTTAAPKSNSRGKLLTSLPLAGTVAAVFVINFLQ